ncbi:MAG: hypothetical protein ACOYN0_00795 [Phycisphaerales bacterium]
MKMSRMMASGVVVAVASAAMADTVQMRFVGTGSGRNVRVTTDSGSRNLFAGQLVHNFSDGTGALSSLTGDRFTYCVDLGQYVSSSSTTYTLSPIADLTAASPMGEDRALAIHSIFNAQPFWPSQASVSQDYAAALQLVIWDIITDYNSAAGVSSLGLSSGSLRAARTDGSPLGLAITSHYATFVSYIGTSGGVGSGVLGLGNDSSQDQILPVSVPAPGAGLLAGLGALAVARRRR